MCQEGNMVPLIGLNGGTSYCPLRVVRQQVPPIWHPKEFAFEIPRETLPEDEKRRLQEKVDKVTHSLKKSPKQMIEWPEGLEGKMKLYSASNEYIKWLEDKRPIDVELYMPLSVFPSYEEPYVLEYIVPNTPRVEPYVPEEVVIDVEEWESQIKEWDEYEMAEATLASKKPKLV